jgi:hypothetical protein
MAASVQVINPVLRGKRWSRRWLYETLKLFNGYRVRHASLKVAPEG